MKKFAGVPRPEAETHAADTRAEYSALPHYPRESLAALRTAAIVPAYNEAGRITNVLKVIAQSQLVDEIVVVTDGCEDSTADEARGFLSRLTSGDLKTCGKTMRVIELEENVGKGGAMTHGAYRTQADVLLFLDADLIGLRAEQVDAIVAPMLHPDVHERADMVMGLFAGARGGAFGWWLSLCHRTMAFLTGQRAIRRDVFLEVPGISETRYGVETAITRYVRHVWRLNVQNVIIGDVTHPLKEEKFGVWRGISHRFGMYNQICGYLITDTLAHWSSAQNRRETIRMRERFNNKI